MFPFKSTNQGLLVFVRFSFDKVKIVLFLSDDVIFTSEQVAN